MNTDAIPTSAIPLIVALTILTPGLTIIAWSRIASAMKGPGPRPTTPTATYRRTCTICRDPWLTDITGPIDPGEGWACPRCMEELVATATIPDTPATLTQKDQP